MTLFLCDSKVMEESSAVVEMSSSSHVASTSSSVVEESTFTSSQQITVLHPHRASAWYFFLKSEIKIKIYFHEKT